MVREDDGAGAAGDAENRAGGAAAPNGTGGTGGSAVVRQGSNGVRQGTGGVRSSAVEAGDEVVLGAGNGAAARSGSHIDEANSSFTGRNASQPQMIINFRVPGYTAYVDDGCRVEFENIDHIVELNETDGYTMCNFVADLSNKTKWGTCQDPVFWYWDFEKIGLQIVVTNDDLSMGSFGCPNPDGDLGPFHGGNLARSSAPHAIPGHHLMRGGPKFPRGNSHVPCRSPGRKKTPPQSFLSFPVVSLVSRAPTPLRSRSLLIQRLRPQIVRPLHVDLIPRDSGLQFHSIFANSSVSYPPFPGASPPQRALVLVVAMEEARGECRMVHHPWIFSPLTPKWHNGLSTLVDGDDIDAGKIPIVIIIHGKFPP
ncbi:hypothetical protein EJB05_54049, partial [Eragrostis curvula]